MSGVLAVAADLEAATAEFTVPFNGFRSDGRTGAAKKSFSPGSLDFPNGDADESEWRSELGVFSYCSSTPRAILFSDPAIRLGSCVPTAKHELRPGLAGWVEGLNGGAGGRNHLLAPVNSDQ